MRTEGENVLVIELDGLALLISLVGVKSFARAQSSWE
jgi:hypothetical protein